MNTDMLECRTTSQESPAQSATARFDSRRVYTVLILAPVIYGAIRYLPPLAFTFLVMAVGTVALLEFYRLGLSTPHHRPFIGAGLLGFAVLMLAPHYEAILVPGLLAALIGALSAPLMHRDSFKGGLNNAAVTLLGVLYVGLTLSFLAAARLLVQGEWLVFFLLLVTWAADTGAYYVGTLYGRHPLAPRISPKKSAEGLAGGLISAVVASFLAHWWFLPILSPLDCVILAVLLTGVGFWGDLAESALKRSVGAKDSGGVLPGHGGMLDRLDSLLFTAPAFYYYVTSIRGIVPLP